MEKEKRLIDVNKVIDAMQKCLDESPDQKDTVAYFAFEAFITALKQEPTVDAVEVVRCKDCKHYKEHPASKRMCCYVHLLTPHHMKEYGFCSYGERIVDNGR